MVHPGRDTRRRHSQDLMPGLCSSPWLSTLSLMKPSRQSVDPSGSQPGWAELTRLSRGHPWGFRVPQRVSLLCFSTIPREGTVPSSQHLLHPGSGPTPHTLPLPSFRRSLHLISRGSVCGSNLALSGCVCRERAPTEGSPQHRQCLVCPALRPGPG